jgi:hypothetical protein
MSETLARTLQALQHLIFSTALKGRFCCISYFTNKVSKAKNG